MATKKTLSAIFHKANVKAEIYRNLNAEDKRVFLSRMNRPKQSEAKERVKNKVIETLELMKIDREASHYFSI